MPSRVEQRIEAHIRVSERLKTTRVVPIDTPPFVTISRQYGCGAVELAELLAEKLTALEGLEAGSWQVYHRQIFDSMTEDVRASEKLLSALDLQTRGAIEELFETLAGQASDLKLLHLLVRTIRGLAALGRCVIVGRGGAVLTQDMPGGIHVRQIAPETWRLEHLIEWFGWDRGHALKTLRAEENRRHGFFQHYLNRDPADPEHYHMILNAAGLSREEQADAVVSLFKSKFLKRDDG